MKQVLVARGVGIATSAIINNVIEEMTKEHNIRVDIKQIKITEVGPYEDVVDLLVTTTMTKEEYKFPVINACNFLTDIGIGETKQQTLIELRK